MKTILHLLAAVSAFAISATAQSPTVLRHSIAPPPEVQMHENFGHAVATSGGFTAVGAPFHAGPGEDIGLVKVFNSTTGALLHAIPNPDPHEDAQFGIALAMSGSRLAVSSYDGVYVYDLASATPTAVIATFSDPNTGAQNFGFALAMDGNRVVVSAPYGNPSLPTPHPAAVYVFAITAPGAPVATFTQQGGNWDDGFGASVAISGSRIVVGVADADVGAASSAGRAFVFDLASATPTVPVVNLVPPDLAVAGEFGLSVDISGSRVIVGALNDALQTQGVGDVFVYDLNSATPATPALTLHNPSATGTRFGWPCAISGNRVVVRSFESSAVSVVVYDLASATPTVPVSTLNNPSSSQTDDFGSDVAISGTSVVIGVPLDDSLLQDAGRAYLYQLPGAAPVAALDGGLPLQTPYFGTAVARSGQLLFVGSPNGNAYGIPGGNVAIYNLESATPLIPVTILQNPQFGSYGYFGASIAVSGTNVVVGAPYMTVEGVGSGAAYVYRISADGVNEGMIGMLRKPALIEGDGFGAAVAIDGNRIVVGSEEHGNVDLGEVYVFDLGVSWNIPVLTLHDPVAGDDNFFGVSVGISGSRVAVGASPDDDFASPTGSVFVFDVAGVSPSVPVATLMSPSPSNGDCFGSAVAISNTFVAVGSRLDDTGAEDAGRVFVYSLANPVPYIYATLNNPSPAAGDWFGRSVAISGFNVAVGATGKNGGAGSAYFYKLASTTPTIPVASLANPASSAGGFFGGALSLTSNSLAVGAPYNSGGNGAAYVFGFAAANTPPFIALNGANPRTVEAFATFPPYVDAGATANDVQDGALTPVITSNTIIHSVPGNYAVTWTATDSGGLSASATRTVNVVDTTAPTIHSDFGNPYIVIGTPLPDFRIGADITDNVGVASVTQSPAPGTLVVAGAIAATITATDAAGNSSSASFTVTGRSGDANITTLYTKGGAVPDADTNPGIGAGAVWTSLGTPALGDDWWGVAFLGKWSAPGQKGAGIFFDDVLISKLGEGVPGIDGATWRSFKDPAVGKGGHVVFIATIQGAGVTSRDDTVVVSKPLNGDLTVVLREGDPDLSEEGPLFDNFISAGSGTAPGAASDEVRYDTVYVEAVLKNGVGPIAKPRGVWRKAPGVPLEKLFRQGDAVAGDTLKNFTFFGNVAGSPAQGRALIGDGWNHFLAHWTLSSGKQLLVAGHGLQTITETDATWSQFAKLGQLSSSSDVRFASMLATARVGFGDITPANAKGIYIMEDAGWHTVARTSEAAPGMGAGAVFREFKDPVSPAIALDSEPVALMAKARGGAVTGRNDEGIWWRHDHVWLPSTLTLLAREGDQPPGAPVGAKWKGFDSLAYGSGPIFTAKLQPGFGGITSANDCALYAVGNDNVLREIMREGVALEGKTVRSFTVLKATVGSQGVARSTNNRGTIAAQVTFTDGTTSIVLIAFPSLID